MNLPAVSGFAVSLAIAISASSISALVLCKMPDGRTYAGDSPPAGCESQKTFSSPATATPNSDSAGSPTDEPRARALDLCKRATHLDADPLTLTALGGWSFMMSWGDVECRADYTGGEHWGVRVTRLSEVKAAQEAAAKASRKQACLKAADDHYRIAWANECAARGFDAGCRLPVAEVLDNRRIAERQECKD